MTLNVMVLENEPDAAAAAEQELRDAGHTVLSCHEDGERAVPVPRPRPALCLPAAIAPGRRRTRGAGGYAAAADAR